MIQGSLARDLARAGWIAAAIMAVLTVGWLIALAAVPGPATDSPPLVKLQFLADHPEGFIGPALVASLALIHVPLWLGLAAFAWPRRPAAALLGVAFGLVYAPLASINYWSQLTVVRGLAGLIDSDPDVAEVAYRLFEFPGGLTSFSYGIDVLAYAVWGCAALAMAWAVAAAPERIARATAALFGLGGAMALGGAIGFVTQVDALELGVLLSGIAFLFALFSAAVLLRLHATGRTAASGGLTLDVRVAATRA